MTFDRLEYVAVLLLPAFAFIYCAVQTIRDFRQRRFAFGMAGLISALVVLVIVVIGAFNVGLSLGLIPPVIEAP